MINLLPPEVKKEYSYARRNAVLARWFAYIGVGLVGIVLITAAGSVYLKQASIQYKAQAAQIQQKLKSQDQAKVEKDVQDISNSLKLAVQVLSKEVLFSKLLKQLATIIPAQASLTNLSITDLQSGVDLTAKTKDYKSATQLLINLTDPANQIFSKADITSITCNSTSTGPGTSNYPCTAVIRAIFAKDNQFLFINSKPGS